MRFAGLAALTRTKKEAAAKFYVPFEQPHAIERDSRAGGRRVNSLPAFASRKQND